MSIRTYDQSSHCVDVVTTRRKHHGRPIAIVYGVDACDSDPDLDAYGNRTGCGYIVALCRDHEHGDLTISLRDTITIAGVDYHGGEWLANWGGPSDTYDDPREWITHHADLGEPRVIVERFAELLRRHWPTSQDAETHIAQTIVRACAMPGDADAGQERIERIGDAVRWLAAELPQLDAAVQSDGRVTLLERREDTCPATA